MIIKSLTLSVRESAVTSNKVIRNTLPNLSFTDVFVLESLLVRNIQRSSRILGLQLQTDYIRRYNGRVSKLRC